MMTHRPTSGGVLLLRRTWLTLLLLVATSWTHAQLTSGTSTSGTRPTSTSAPQATCGPSGTGQTACGGDGVASQNLNEVDAGAGNPIHLITGNKYQREVDLPALPGVLGLEIVRHYNSQFSRLSTPNGIVGRGWKLSYETRLYPGGVSLQVLQADGARIIFSRDPLHPSVCTTSDPSQGRIKVIKSPQGRRYEWVWPSGKVLSFNAQGRLTQILAPTGEFVSLQYSGTGLLVSVTDPQNRSLRLNYLDSREAAKREKFTGVVSIDTPVGRFAYEYGSTKPQGSQITDRELRANLVKVNLPTRYNPDEQAHPLTQRGTTSSTLGRLYHYEDARWPTLLTGISVQATGQAGQLSRQRLATWGYDVNGQGILSEYPGTGGHRLQFDRRQPGQTVITDAQGRQTTYTHAIVQGHYRLLESRGAGCTPCSPANQRYRYDSQARLTHQIDLNAQGQAVRGWRFYPDHQGRTLATAMLVFDTQGQAREHIVEQRQYQGDSPWPAVVRTPSVVQGRWREQRWSYNAQGQPTRVVQTGWVPALPQGAAGTGGTVEPQPLQPLKREVNYSYQRINNRSVLVAVDGPLPGTADTRRYVWDKRGDFVSTEELPGKLRRSVERDPAGRVVTSTDVDDVPVRLRYTPMGQALHWQRGEAEVKLTLDAQERPTRIELPDGEVQLLAYGGPQGQGSALAMSSNAGWARWLARPEPGAMPASAPSHVAAPEPAQAPPWTDEQLIFDDFGRLVAMHTQTTGWELRSYDAGNQIVARHTSDGTDWRWQRDALGRITRHVVSRPGQAEQVTTLRYRGPWLIDVVHPHESEHLSYDALGRMSTRTVRRQHLSYTERLAYDAADRVTRHDLPEGGSLRYAWGVGRVLHAIEHDNGTITALLGEPVSQWLGWGRRTIIEPLPSQPMATTAAASSAASAGSSPQARLQAAAMAQRGYRWGNGVEVRWHLDERGQLAALRYVGAPRPMAWLDAWLPNAQAANEPSLIDLSYDYDAWGRMSTRTQDGVRTQFGYDALGRLLLAQPGDAAAQPDTPVEYYAYAQGRLMASQVQGRNHDWRQIKTERSPSGLPSRIESSQGIRGLSYSADNRLIEVSQGAQVLAHYAHNTHGQRIRKTVGTQLSTDYLWHQGQLVGETLAQQMPQTRQTTARVEERLARRYVYAHGVPVAVLDYSEGAALDAQANDEDAGSWPEVRQWARALWRALTTDAPELSYVHANEIGAPVAVTNAQGQVLWRASYSAFGQLDPVRPQGVAKPFVLNLRLPGQYFDAETGWHDNGLRTYDPQRGEYLEPDPLGPLPNRASGRLLTQPYAYANHNPLIYADPSGLILFAFDGTGNSDPGLNGAGISNVVRFRNLYEPSSVTRRYYISGVGTVDRSDPTRPIDPAQYVPLSSLAAGTQDAGGNFSGRARIARMVEYFNQAATIAPDSEVMDVDIIGFSRGAAQARDFANRIVANTVNGYYRYSVNGVPKCQRVNYRFMGLWDTVLSTDLASGPSYRLSIPDQFAYVAQAVALNEHRGGADSLGLGRSLVNSYGNFPLESIMAGMSSTAPVAGRVRIERGFVGAHSDIGGGYLAGQDQLSQVALAWMVNQATAAGVPMGRTPEIIIDRPVIHDPSDNQYARDSNKPPLANEDRQVHYMGGSVTTQKQMVGTGMTYQDTLGFIEFRPGAVSPGATIAPKPADHSVGHVRMANYLTWLNDHGYGLRMRVQ